MACVFHIGSKESRLAHVAHRIKNWDDARFIVRACNSHDDLLEACQLLVRSLGYWMESESERGNQHANDQEAMSKGVAAIVKAKSQTC